MWIVNFFKELKVWKTIRKVCRENKQVLENSGLKFDWLGHIYTVINRDPNIQLGSEEDRYLLMKELNMIQNVLVKLNIIDLLAYELVPLESTEFSDDGSEEIFENGYLVKFTPAEDVTKQYVKPWTCFCVFTGIIAVIGIIGFIIGSIFLYK